MDSYKYTSQVALYEDPNSIRFAKDNSQLVLFYLLYRDYQNTDDVPSSGNSQKRSTTKDRLKIGKLKKLQMESLTKFSISISKGHLKIGKLKKLQMASLITFSMMKNTDDAPSSVKVPKTTTSIGLSLGHSHYVAKKVLRMSEYKVKTSSDADANQDQDLARVEGLHPREDITRHSALLVPPREA